MMKNNWPVKNLGEIAIYINGKAFKEEEWTNAGLPIIRIQNLTGTQDNFNYFNGKLENRYLVKNGDILLSWSASLGVYIWDRGEAALNQHIFKVIPNEDFVAKSFLFYLLNTKVEEMRSKVHGGTMKHITKNTFEKIQVWLPSLSNQKEIVVRLDAIRKVQELIDLQIQKTEELFESLLEKEIDSLPHTEMKKLNDVCLKITDGAHRTPTYTTSGIPFLSVRNMINGTVEFKNTKFISNEEHQELIKRCNPEFLDILIAKSGTTGVATLIATKDKFSLFVSVALVKPNKDLINPKFLVYFLNSKIGKKQMIDRTKGGTIKNLHIEEIKEIVVPLLTLKDQKEIVDKLEAIQEYKKILQIQKELYKELFDSVLAKSMKGEMDD